MAGGAYSPSRLQVFQRCTRQYYYKYVIKLPSKQQAAQSVGISLHGALEEVQRAGGLATVGLQGALALLNDRWEKEGFASPEAEAEAKRQAEAMLKNYLAQHGEGEGKPVLIEQRLEGAYDDVPFLGIVDRVDELPNGELELIDYKSGRPREIGPTVTQQLAIYRHLIKQKLGAYPARISIHHLSANVAIAVDLEPPEWDAVLKRAASSARAIEAEQDFDPEVGAHCRWCDYNHRCLAFQRSVKGTPRL